MGDDNAELIRCNICREKLDKPVSPFPRCCHLFCLHCAQSYSETGARHCPVCKDSNSVSLASSRLDVATLPRHILLEELEIKKGVHTGSAIKKTTKTSRLLCNECELAPNANECEDCKLSLCAFCSQAHLRSKRTRSHKLHKFTDPEGEGEEEGEGEGEEEDDVSIPDCVHHPDNEARYVCLTCRDVVCDECWDDDEIHDGHNITRLEDCANDLMEEIAAVLQGLDENSARIDRAVYRAKSKAWDVHHHHEVEAERSNQFYNALIQQITALRDRQSRELKLARDLRINKIDAAISGLRVAQWTVTKVLPHVDKMLRIASFESVLRAIQYSRILMHVLGISQQDNSVDAASDFNFVAPISATEALSIFAPRVVDKSNATSSSVLHPTLPIAPLIEPTITLQHPQPVAASAVSSLSNSANLQSPARHSSPFWERGVNPKSLTAVLNDPDSDEGPPNELFVADTCPVEVLDGTGAFVHTLHLPAHLAADKNDVAFDATRNILVVIRSEAIHVVSTKTLDQLATIELPFEEGVEEDEIGIEEPERPDDLDESDEEEWEEAKANMMARMRPRKRRVMVDEKHGQIVVCGRRHVNVYKSMTGELISAFELPLIRAVALHAASGLLFCIHNDEGEIAVWDKEEGRRLKDIELPERPSLVAITADGNLLSVRYSDNRVHVLPFSVYVSHLVRAKNREQRAQKREHSSSPDEGTVPPPIPIKKFIYL